MRRSASPTTFQASCQIAGFAVFIIKIKLIETKVRSSIKRFQRDFLPNLISIRENIVQRKK